MFTNVLVSAVRSDTIEEIKSSGSITVGTPRLTLAEGWLQNSKVSVNTGSYKPGVYRNNPYTVYTTVWANEPISLSGDRTTRATYLGSTYVDTLSGPVGKWAFARMQSVGKLPSITQNVASYESEALAKAYAKVASGELQLGEDIGELRQTLEMVRSPLSGFRDFLYSNKLKNLGLLQRLKHHAATGSWAEKGGKALTGKAAAKVAADTWLEIRYGIVPLINTLEGLMKVWNEGLNPFDPKKILCARSKVKAPVVTTKLSYLTASIGYIDSWIDLTATEQIVGVAGVHWQATERPSAGTSFGLAPQFLPEIAFQLTKLSFVLDWWLDVSSWLGAHRFLIGAKILGAYSGIRVQRDVTLSLRTGFRSPYVCPQPANHGVVCRFIENYYKRTVRTSPPLLPQLKLDFRSLTHVADALALILQGLLRNIK